MKNAEKISWNPIVIRTLAAQTILIKVSPSTGPNDKLYQ